MKQQPQRPVGYSRPDWGKYDPCVDYRWAFRVYMRCKTDAARERWKHKLEQIKTKLPQEGCGYDEY